MQYRSELLKPAVSLSFNGLFVRVDGFVDVPPTRSQILRVNTTGVCKVSLLVHFLFYSHSTEAGAIGPYLLCRCF